MDHANSAAGWIGAVATAIGLSSLVVQGNAIQERMDPFFSLRGAEALGCWTTRQPGQGWHNLRKPSLQGPLLIASWCNKFCGTNELYLSRQPPKPDYGKMSWTAVMAAFKPSPVLSDAHSNLRHEHPKSSPRTTLRTSGARSGMHQGVSKGLGSVCSWPEVKMQDLVRHHDKAGIHITRSTFITLLCISNAREAYKFSGPSGHRAAYPSYAGIWAVEWPIGRPAVVTLSLHDLFMNPGGNYDMYPSCVGLRVDRCINMLAGIINTRSGTHVAFPGRKALPGRLEFHSRGFAGSHGSRHFFNMSGGDVSVVDLLFWKNISLEDIANFEADPSIRQVLLPSSTKGQNVQLFMFPYEYEIIMSALDMIPWANLSWSMHRGMRDILLAVGKPIMDHYREQLALTLQRTVETQVNELCKRGWNHDFVTRSMPNIVYSTVMAGQGDSGDVVRALTDTAFVSLGLTQMWALDLERTTFWSSTMKSHTTEGSSDRLSEVSDQATTETVSDAVSEVARVGVLASSSAQGNEQLSGDAVIALTKFVVLEWSQELDYQLYHDLPVTLLLV